MADSTEPQDDETLADVLLRHAQAGDLGCVPEVLSGRGVLAYDSREQQAIIRKCVVACAAGGAARLVDALYEEMLSFDAALLLRAQTEARYRMRRVDEGHGPTIRELPPEAIAAIERVGLIEERIVYLAQNYGRVQRSLGLAGRYGKRGGGSTGKVLQLTDFLDDDEAPASGGE